MGPWFEQDGSSDYLGIKNTCSCILNTSSVYVLISRHGGEDIYIHITLT